MFPVFVGLIGDLEAQSSLLLVGKSSKCPYPDLTHMVKQEELDNPPKELRRRTEREMLDVITKAHRKVAAAAARGDQLELKEAKLAASNMLKEVSLSQVLLLDPRSLKGVEVCYEPPGGMVLKSPALFFFPNTDIYELVCPDFLHTISKGIADHLLNANNPRSVVSLLAEAAGAAGAKALEEVSAPSSVAIFFLLFLNLNSGE